MVIHDLDDLGYPYDVGHLQIFQYQLRNQSISIPHWIQPCHSQPFVGSPPIAQVRRTGGIRSSPPTFSASGSCGPSWIHEERWCQESTLEKGMVLPCCLSGIAFFQARIQSGAHASIWQRKKREAEEGGTAGRVRCCRGCFFLKVACLFPFLELQNSRHMLLRWV